MAPVDGAAILALVGEIVSAPPTAEESRTILEAGATGKFGSGVTRTMEDLQRNVESTLFSQDVWSRDGW